MTVQGRPYVIGLTGGIGSGKTTVAQLFEQHQIVIVDTDMIAHRLTQPDGLAIPAIEAAFGPAFIAADGAMDRPRMRAQVFGNDAARLQLQAILHPLIRTESERLVRAANSAYVVLVVPLLFESGRWQETTQRTLLVDCPEDEQVRRVMHRSGLEEAQIRAIMAKQMTRAERRLLADDVLENGADATDLGWQVERLHQKYLHLAHSFHE
jgi:dephospho-CoA kinase